jgi:hypothetical protein
MGVCFTVRTVAWGHDDGSIDLFPEHWLFRIANIEGRLYLLDILLVKYVRHRVIPILRLRSLFL